MTVIVKGHSGRSDDATTFVPVGTKLRFYSGFDVNIAQSVELVAIADGTKATPQETIDGTGQKTDVINYEFDTMEDRFVARWLAMGGESRIPIYFVGSSDIKDGMRLCASPDTCTDTHTCQGVLGILKNEKDIVILACRGYVDEDKAPEISYGKDAKDPLRDLTEDTIAFVDQILDLAKRDPAAAEREVDELPQGSIAVMIDRIDFEEWQMARHLKDRAQAGDFEQMLGHLRANEDQLDGIMEWLDDIPSYGAAVDKAVIAKIRTFADEYTKAPSEAVLEALGSRKAIDIALKALDSDWQPDDKALTAIETRNAANVKNLPDGDGGDILAGGLLVLIGDGHDDDAVGYVERQDDFEQGTFQVGKGGAFSAGTLDVTEA